MLSAWSMLIVEEAGWGEGEACVGVDKVWDVKCGCRVEEAVKSDNSAGWLWMSLEIDEGCHFDNSLEFFYNHATSFISY